MNLSISVTEFHRISNWFLSYFYNFLIVKKLMKLKFNSKFNQVPVITLQNLIQKRYKFIYFTMIFQFHKCRKFKINKVLPVSLCIYNNIPKYYKLPFLLMYSLLGLVFCPEWCFYINRNNPYHLFYTIQVAYHSFIYIFAEVQTIPIV